VTIDDDARGDSEHQQVSEYGRYWVPVLSWLEFWADPPARAIRRRIRRRSAAKISVAQAKLVILLGEPHQEHRSVTSVTAVWMRRRNGSPGAITSPLRPSAIEMTSAEEQRGPRPSSRIKRVFVYWRDLAALFSRSPSFQRLGVGTTPCTAA